MNCSTITFTGHALVRMFERHLTAKTVTTAVSLGKVIAEYLDDKPYPSQLLLYLENETPVHVLVARRDSDNACYIITVYVPDATIWQPDFKTRKT